MSPDRDSPPRLTRLVDAPETLPRYTPAMPNIERHAPGTFCWAELATSRQPEAKQFYMELFGWTADDMPMGPADSYTMFKIQGRSAGAAYTLRPEQVKQGVPAHWGLYVA